MCCFAVIDSEGIGLSWAARLQDEGHEVLYYVHEKMYREVGKGIVRKTESLSDIFQWAKDKKAIAVYMFSGMGKSKKEMVHGAEDFVKAGIPVVLGGAFCDKLESDRDFGLKVAERIGMRIPPTHNFSSVSAARMFCKMHPAEEWFFKPNSRPDGDCDTTQSGTGKDLAVYLTDYQERMGDRHTSIVQMKIPGVALSTNGWFNGSVFLKPHGGTLEHKKLMNDEHGPSTGCAIEVTWFYENEKSKIFEHINFDKLGYILASRGATPGLYDLNAIISEKAGPWGPAGIPYFLEWTPRLGWDSEAISPRLLKGGLGDFVEKLAHRTLSEAPFRTDMFAYSTHISISPYPWGDPDVLVKLKKTARHTKIGTFKSLWADNFVCYGLGFGLKGYYCANDEGNVGVAVAIGKSLKALHKEAVEFAETMRPSSMQFRTDGDKVLGKDADKLRELGFYVPGGII